MDYLAGEVLLFDKPLNWTSFQVVNKVRWLIRKDLGIKKIKVGHAGTLDPLATGLLILCTGKKTKTIDQIQGQTKEYTGTITLGATTPSYDLETEFNETFDISRITNEEIETTAASFIGEQEQTPPIFSAKKIDGQKAYDIARKGGTVEMRKNTITIHEFEVTKIDLPNVDFRISCTKGTYIRSIAFDFGDRIKNGAHLSALRRTKIGDYDVQNALQLTDFEESFKNEAQSN